GVGMDVCPFVYAHAGCSVLATDVSEYAIGFLKHLEPRGIACIICDVDEMNTSLGIDSQRSRTIDVHFRVHDFRELLGEADFDLVLNMKAHQALPEMSMQRAAHVFFDALKPGGYAIFDTMNVQGQRRDRLEGTLTAAGFYIPYHESELWYRQRLSETGIPYNM